MDIRLFPLIVLITALAAQTQTSLPPTNTSLVTGHVYCADTNSPARMATVMLEAVKDVNATQNDAKQSEQIHLISVQTLLDGSFTIRNVAPGSYYVLVSAPGYVSPLAALGTSVASMQKADKELKQKFDKLLPRVTVQPNLPATAEVRLERGAAISGSVRYDDGSPAAGLSVKALLHENDKWVPVMTNTLPFTQDNKTDDQGNYRISGLSAGNYLIQTDLKLTQFDYSFFGTGAGISTANENSLPVYSGSQFRTRDAKPFPVKLGEERSGEDLEIPLAKLHTLSGFIIAARDGHVTNGGTVSLLHADDKSVAATTRVSKDDKAFTFSFVSEGDYLLRASNAADLEFVETPNPPGTMPPTNLKENTLHRYGTADQPIHIENDVTNATITVPEPAANTTASSQ